MINQYRVTGIIDFIRFADRRPDGTELWELARLDIQTDIEAVDETGAEAQALDIASKHLESADWDGRPEVVMVDGEQVAQIALPLEVTQ